MLNLLLVIPEDKVRF